MRYTGRSRETGRPEMFGIERNATRLLLRVISVVCCALMYGLATSSGACLSLVSKVCVHGDAEIAGAAGIRARDGGFDLVLRHSSRVSSGAGDPLGGRCMLLRGGARDELTGDERRDVKRPKNDAGQEWEDQKQEPTESDQITEHNVTNQTAAMGNCAHGLPAAAHCMDCEVMAFLQRAAAILQHAGGRMDSTMFARQWTLQYPDDPLTPEQVAKAVGGILKESGYFHVEETNDPDVKLFELIEVSEDGTGLDAPPTMCLPFELPPPEKDSFVDNARKWLAMTGVGRHPAVGSGLMTHQELEKAIEPTEGNSGRKRHDEVQYTGKWGESLVGYWTLGPCDGSNGCLHRERINVGCRPHWTCCGSEDIHSVFCLHN